MTNELPRTAADFAKWAESVEFHPDAPIPADLPPHTPADKPADGIPVKRSVKWSVETDERLKATARAKGITQSELIRQYIEMGLAAEHSGMVVDLADALRLLATVAHRPAA
ncbi:ribbon-helix-helix protein, CopG family [Nocardia uniformis]|uniref:Ribbon-helix-helix protein, CopG family n=1 Tax=Nocardia uniformis TaxID=53432 RepID=A0A849BY60_9NOCA|nr:CopG family transcriptional regulator [Nocardia uniformis]NNH69045.1 ribbon-helix-helix protein, CopG family [Nocardia uniformis]